MGAYHNVYRLRPSVYFFWGSGEGVGEGMIKSLSPSSTGAVGGGILIFLGSFLKSKRGSVSGNMENELKSKAEFFLPDCLSE